MRTATPSASDDFHFDPQVLQIRLQLKPSGQPTKLLRAHFRDCKLRRSPINFIDAYAPPVGIPHVPPHVFSKVAESMDQESLLVLLRVKMDNDGSHANQVLRLLRSAPARHVSAGYFGPRQEPAREPARWPRDQR